ncbi:ECF transporter S component [Shouchella clausii]|uniref:Thiamine ABC transporter permease n=3 Tax=Shouchella TaxID=2893057 RepID=Q5WGN7_SHOC1|nr:MULTISPECIES: ECF transporter S component [Shouchella]MCM3312708.1 ECF transporter S component [Psychrobacillus sp. MER TA 17]ALA50877.1 Substrate-specific component YkoE of thiamin-regulated ECF transporter for HydroxyMethylPyrimidine [Shouchella clausii]KKI85874.1 thiamine ABC transporter permease [Shouchella clausii]MBU3231686.1 ECF transporter S component [Shouchella clausii]MBU3265030.1 ECF transporter S component [Shouchella clausii]
MNKNRLRLTDMIVTILISVVFAVVYRLWTPVTDLVSLPGLQADQLLYGMWFIAGTIAALLIKKPGVALLAETAAASGEFFAGSPYGPLLLLYGALQGLGIELAFALFKYRVYTVWTASLGAVFASFASLGLDYFNAYLSDLTTWNITLRVVFRTLGSIIIAGFLASALVRALEKTGVSTLLRPVSQADYDLFASKRSKKDE